MSGCDGSIVTVGSCDGGITTMGSCDGDIDTLSCCDEVVQTYAEVEDAFTLSFGIGFSASDPPILIIDELPGGGVPPNSGIVLDNIEPGPITSDSPAEPSVFVGATSLSQGGGEFTHTFNEPSSEPPGDNGGDNISKTGVGVGGGNADVIVPE